MLRACDEAFFFSFSFWEQLEKDRQRERQRNRESNTTKFIRNKWYLHTFLIEF